MTLEEIDRALADWKARRQRIDDNLVALETDPNYTLLEQAGSSGLEGVTRDQVVPALDAIRELFAQRRLLDAVLEQAATLRAGISRIWPGDGPREIDRLLHGPSIALPPVETPLARRGLLDAAETTTAISPEQLLAAMVTAFDGARDAVAAVAAAWDRLGPAVQAAQAEAARLSRLAADLGDDATAAIAAAGREIDAVQSRVARDPLGATGVLTDSVDTRLREVSARLEQIATRRAEAEAGHQRAQRTLADLRTAHEQATSAAARARAEVVTSTAPPAPIDPARIEGLADWLQTLEATLAARRWDAAAIGLGRWMTAATAALAETREVAEAASTLLDRRDALAGRLAARRQQARTLRARGRTIDPALDEVAGRAADLLGRAPCPVDDAEQLVVDYEAGLRADPA